MIWRSRRKLPKFNSANIKPRVASQLATQAWVYYALYQCFRKYTCTLSRECDVRNSSLSPGRKFMSLTSVWGMLWTAALHAPRQSHLKLQQVHTTEERAKMWRYGTENIPAKAAGHLSQDFRWQAAMRQRGLLRGGYIIFWLGDRIAKFKVDQN